MLLQAGQLGDELRALRDELCIDPDPEVQEAHLAAMDLAALELAAAPNRSEVPVLHPAPARRRRMRAFALPVAATLGVLGLTCGLAAAGGLPGPAQRQASRVAGAVGWEIPDHFGSSSRQPSDKPDPGGRRNLAPTTSTTASTGSVHEPGSQSPGAGAGSGAGRQTSGTPPVTNPAASTGSSGSSPGNSGAAPGHTGTDPTTVTSVAPGKSGDAPGHTDSAPGKSGTAPGKSGTTPGNSGNPPGQARLRSADS